MTLVLIIGLLMTAIALPLAAKRAWFLFSLITAGKPAPDRVENVTKRTAQTIGGQFTEVLGQKKLLKWTIPGTAHAFVMYAFLILASVYLEAYGVLISRNPEWHFLIFNSWGPLGFVQDLIGVLCLIGLVVFSIIRIKDAPEKLGRKSRFDGSHLGGAWFTLFMIFNVLWTMFLFRGASSALGNLGYGKWAFASYAVGKAFGGPTDSGVVEGLEKVGLLLHIGVMLVFLVFVLNSKHLHIFIAPLNVMFKRPDASPALGAVKPMMSEGKPVDLEDIEDLDEDTTLGVGSIEDFSWKGILDFATCTECGRCQSQCPAWNTEKPLSPKMLIMNLRDHAFAKAPYLLEEDEAKREKLPADVLAAAERPLVGETEGPAWEPTGGAVIDNDVLWSCTSCGACVNQCPVDIEHVDHIIDMRRYQVLVESNFPSELNGLFKGMENKGNPWNMSPNARMDWAKDLPFDVKVVGEDVESLDEVEWLFWVGCAGAYEDRAKKTTRAVAELLDTAGVDFAVLGNGETCTGDPARRAGNEFIFQGLAAQNAEVFKETKVKKVVATCPHCMNTLKNEYSMFGVELEVVHHTQLLNRLVREKKLAPVAANGGDRRSITYHDPCYLGRHNNVYSPPRELLDVIPDADLTEMPRNSERSFCCGAGGARMWMEETIGERVNVNRTKEAVATGAEQIAVGCPFCRVMLEDGLTAEQSAGNAGEDLEVLDVAQMLLASVKGEAPKAKAKSKVGAGAAAGATGGTAVDTKAEPSAGDVTQTEETVTDTEDMGPNAKASGGSSLFDTPESGPSEKDEEKTAQAEAAGKAETWSEQEEDTGVASGGGSLFDLGGGESPEEKAEEAAPRADAAQTPAPETTGSSTEESSSSDEGIGGGSLFDLGGGEEPPQSAAEVSEDGAGDVDRSADDADADVAAPTEQASAAEEAAEERPSAGASPSSDIPEGGSLFDIAEPEGSAEPAAAAPQVSGDGGGDLDRSTDDADADVEAPTEQATAAEEAAEERDDAGTAPEPPAGDSSDDIPSLKDIKARHAEGGSDTDEQTPESPAESGTQSADSSAEGTAESEPASDSESKADSQADSEAESEAAEKPKPASSGEAHQPRTDTEIGEGNSLFDL